MAKRKIIRIDESKCDGCGLCAPNCPEGALQIIDGKARLVNDIYCDGLGACLGHCPRGAIAIEEREAQDFDEKKVAAHLVDAHAHHAHGASGCPGARVMDMRGQGEGDAGTDNGRKTEDTGRSRLRQWPVQLMLVPPDAPYLKDADLLIAADCVPFAYAGFHEVLLKGKVLLVGCPKLDDIGYYKEKIDQIVKGNEIRSITYARMEVPCCAGLMGIIEEAVVRAGRNIPVEEVVVGIKGERLK